MRLKAKEYVNIAPEVAGARPNALLTHTVNALLPFLCAQIEPLAFIQVVVYLRTTK